MSWYTPTGNPLTRASGLSATIRAEFQLIKSAFDSLPSTFGSMAQQDASAVTITGGTIAVSSLTVGGSAAITAASSNTLTNKTMSGGSNTFSNIPWSALTSTPTTLSGYGITNAATNGAVTGSGLTMTTARLLGRTTASTGAIEELTAGSGLTLSGGSLTVDSGTTANKIVKLDGSARIPAVDGSLVTNRFQRGYIDGLRLSYSSATTIGIAAGKCRSTADDADITLASAFTKVIQAAGAYGAGTGGNGLFTGARANSTWYHVFAGIVSGSADIGFDTSVSGANAAGAGMTNVRRIGSVKTDGSGNILSFQQNGDRFTWDVMPSSADVNATNPGTSAVLATMSVPTGLKVECIFTYASQNNTNNHYVLVTDPAQTDTTPSGSANSWVAYGSVGAAGFWNGRQSCMTDTSGRIRYRLSASGASDAIVMNTVGWIDRRGKDA